MQTQVKVCAKTPTDMQILPELPFLTAVSERAANMKSCAKCGRPQLSDSAVCGRCEYPKLGTKQIPTDNKSKNGDYERTLDAVPVDHAASLAKAVDMTAFRSGWAAGLMMAQVEYCQKLIYRKPKTRVLDVSNARTYRPHRCDTCEKTRPGNV